MPDTSRVTMVRVNATIEQQSRPAPRRLDASMSLLADIAETALDPDYRRVTQARRESEGRAEAEGARSPSRPRWLGSVALALGLLVVGLLISVAAARVQANAGVISAERESLMERIRVASDDADSLQEQVSSLESDIRALESAQLESTSVGEQVAGQMSTLRSAVGTQRVVGPGITVLLNDAPEDWPGRDPDTSDVLDIDLQQVANALWTAGAEAIAINGQRLTPGSAIRQANDIIQVNYRPLSSPYHVSAVGNDQELATKFDQGAGGQWLRAAKREVGIQFEITIEDDDLVLPAGNATLINAVPEEVP